MKNHWGEWVGFSFRAALWFREWFCLSEIVGQHSSGNFYYMNLALYKIRSTQNTSIYIKFSLSLSNLEPNFFLFLLHSLFKTAAHLVWSVFGLTNLETMESHDTWSSTIVDVLYVMFLILSVIMLINMLVALLTNTYNKVEVNDFAVPFWPCSQEVTSIIL